MYVIICSTSFQLFPPFGPLIFSKVAAQSLPSLDLHYPSHAPRPEALALRFLVLGKKTGWDGSWFFMIFPLPITKKWIPRKWSTFWKRWLPASNFKPWLVSIRSISGDVNNIIHQHNFFEGQFFEIDEKSVKHGENMVILRKTGILKWRTDFCLGFLSP